MAKLSEIVKDRRKRLGIRPSALAKRSGVPLGDVFQLMESQQETSNLPPSIAETLGILPDGTESVPAEELKRSQAHKKALRIARMVQGTMALEGQGVRSQEEFDELVRRSEEELLSSPIRLWSVY